MSLINPRDSAIPLDDYAVYENLGLGMIAGVLRARGHTVDVIDGYAENLTHDQVVALAESAEPDLVGLTCTYQSYPDMIAVAEGLREKLPGVHITAGGEHATYTAERIVTQTNLFDSVVRGEGEDTIVELAERLENGRPLSDVLGLVYCADGIAIANGDRKAIRDLDAIPFASRDTLEGCSKHGGRSILIGMLASRGCTSRCTFCNANEFFRLGGGKVLRRRSPKNVVDEIAKLYNDSVCALMQRGIDVKLYFYDATFITKDAASKRWVAEIASEILERDVVIPFKAFVRADTFESTESDDALINLLKAAGLDSVFIGFESGTDEVLEAYNKSVSAEQNRRCVEVLKKHGILSVTNGFIMFGPYTTIESLRANADFLLFSGQASFWNLSQRLQIFPGVKIKEQLAIDGLLLAEDSETNVYPYRFVDSRVGQLAAKIDMNDQPLIQRENSLVRYIQNTTRRIGELLVSSNGGRSDPLAGEDRWSLLENEIGEVRSLNYRTFMRFVDSTHAGTLDEDFDEVRDGYLQDLGGRLDRLEGAFQSLLTVIGDD